MQGEIGSHNSSAHIVNSVNGETPIIDCNRDICSEVRWPSSEVNGAGHVYIASSRKVSMQLYSDLPRELSTPGRPLHTHVLASIDCIVA